MPRIRVVEILNYRGVKAFRWHPSPGVNCLIGPGDSCKSTVLDAIGLCLGHRRSTPLTDADFYNLNVSDEVSITITLGDLPEPLKSIENYGLYLRGYVSSSRKLLEEPEDGSEPVLTIRVTVPEDLIPEWELVSERATQAGASRDILFKDRVSVTPSRLGATGGHNLGWSRGSVLNHLSTDRPEAAGALAELLRSARSAFGTTADVQLESTLKIVNDTARGLGVPVGDHATAMLDSDSVFLGGGTISLHTAEGVPLSSLGSGSSRLLIGGLQRKASQHSTVVLIDEVEFGLEPHRIIRLLSSLGSKETPPSLQVFMTTHSPVVVKELSAEQLFVLRPVAGGVNCHPVGEVSDIQGTVRAHPEALLAPSVVACEGASEVGLLRGLDQYRVSTGLVSMAAHGVALADCGGHSRVVSRAVDIQKLGFRVSVVKDNDVQGDTALESVFTNAGGALFTWRQGRALEDELFLSLPAASIEKLLDLAVELNGDQLVDEHIRTASSNAADLASCRKSLTDADRAWLGKAAQSKKHPWFKSVTAMERVAREVVGPVLDQADAGFVLIVESLMQWTDLVR